eukprot:3381174-Rhodomonas_salina.1
MYNGGADMYNGGRPDAMAPAQLNAFAAPSYRPTRALCGAPYRVMRYRVSCYACTMQCPVLKVGNVRTRFMSTMFKVGCQ